MVLISILCFLLSIGVTRKAGWLQLEGITRLGKEGGLGQELRRGCFSPGQCLLCKIIALFKKHELQVHSMHSFW